MSLLVIAPSLGMLDRPEPLHITVHRYEHNPGLFRRFSQIRSLIACGLAVEVDADLA